MRSTTVTAFNCRMMFALLIFAGVGRADPLDKWTWRNPVPPPNLSNVAYGNGQYVAVGLLGTIATSTDGGIWVVRQSGTQKNLYSIIYGNDQFVAVGATILTSTDGVNWIEHSAQDQN